MRLADLPSTRPVLAAAANLLLIAIGVGAAFLLPIREYPNIDPPTVSVTTQYQGAPAEVVEREVTRRIEDNLSGISGIRLIEARSRNEVSSISLQFVAGTNIDAAAADVRDKVAGVRSDLPDTIEEPIVEKADADDQPMMYITLRSPSIGTAELTDIAQRRIVDALGSVSGVSRVTIGGEKRYAMRIWLDRQAMAARGVAPGDVADRLRAENVELPAGLVETPTQEIVVRAETRLRTAEEFAALAIRGEGENRIRIGDVARVEVGVENEKGGFRADGVEAIALGIVRQSDANTLEVANGVKAELERLRPTLPANVEMSVGYDESVFIRETLINVGTTLAQSIAVVLVVIFLFLGSLKGTLIPAATIPAAIIPAAVVAAAFGFSINVLTILAVILAIGLCTDDAVVIMENIRRRQQERGEALLVAAARSTRELGAAVLASSLVLVAVILPLAFLQGNVGLLFREFAVVLVTIVVISGFSAISLGPMLSVALLGETREPGRLASFVNRGLDRLSGAYGAALGFLVVRPWLPLVAGAAFAAAGVAAFLAIPAELAPDEDRGAISVVVEGPEGASARYMGEQVAGIERALADLTGEGKGKPVAGLLSIVVPFFGSGQAPTNTARVIVRLKPWAEREMGQAEVRTQVQRRLAGITGVRAFAVNPPKLGQRGGGRGLQVAVSGLDRAEVIGWANAMIADVRRIEGLVNPDTDYKDTRPQISIGVDRPRAAAIGVDARTLGSALQIMFGSLQVTRYVDRGEEYDVLLQAQAPDRSSARDIENVFVRAGKGELVPLSSVVRLQETSTVRELRRVDRLAAVRLEANLSPDITLGEALERVEAIAAEKLPAAAQLKYLGESRDYKETGNAILYALGLVLVLVYLLMAAQFESFLHPLTILTSAPVALAGGLLTVWAFGFTLNIYSQIGMILLIGLVAKNAILLVELANQRRDEGVEPVQAVVDAARQRLRPILMTSLATVLGAVPLILESGAGAEARVTVGIVTTGGVTLGTLLTLFVVPAAYALVARFARPPGALADELSRLENELTERGPPAE